MKLGRLPNRIRRYRDTRGLLGNWPEFLWAEWTRRGLKRLQFRNGVRITADEHAALILLFNEVWLNRIYSPPGYEVNRGDVVVDLGANVGVFTLFAASRAAGVHVHACEPSPRCVEALRRNIEASNLGNVTVHPLAVAAEAGIVQLHMCEENWARNSITDTWTSGQSVKVPAVSLDELIHQCGADRIDLLKVDIEGAEYDVLSDRNHPSLQRVRRIVCEYHNLDGVRNGAQLARQLSEAGFSPEREVPLDAHTGMLYAARLP
jgi:FkbM family methyltransferase